LSILLGENGKNEFLKIYIIMKKYREKGIWERLGLKKNSREIIYVDTWKCTGCERCVNICRHNVFCMISTHGNIYAAACCLERCSSCGKCIVLCPERAIEFVKRINNN
jgi:formate hydrogenlyase subunit 6/NADH:ubiquinone oxidoreductase subunit I